LLRLPVFKFLQAAIISENYSIHFTFTDATTMDLPSSTPRLSQERIRPGCVHVNQTVTVTFTPYSSCTFMLRVTGFKPFRSLHIATLVDLTEPTHVPWATYAGKPVPPGPGAVFGFIPNPTNGSLPKRSIPPEPMLDLIIFCVVLDASHMHQLERGCLEGVPGLCPRCAADSRFD
jgi:hypothetical protein